LYLNLRGFPEPVCRFVRDQFQQKGYRAQFQELRLDWFNGIIAQDLVLADLKRPDHVLARINEVALRIHWLQLWSGGNVLGGLRIANANISIPLPADESGPVHFTASDAYANLRFEEDGTIRLEQLTGMYCGVYLFVTGRIKPRTGMKIETTPKDTEKQSKFLSRILRELHAVHCREPLDLYLDFDVDLANPLGMSARARLHGKDLLCRRVLINSLKLDVAMEEGSFRILQGDAELGGGNLSLNGDYDFARGLVDIRLRSSMDPLVLRRWLPPEAGKELEQLRLFQNPRLELQYRLSPETGTVPVLSGTLETGGLEFRGVKFRALSVKFENRGPEIKILAAHVVMPRGELTGQGRYHIESSDFEYEFDSTLDPTTLIPLMSPVMKRWFSPCELIDLPHVTARVRGDFVDPDAFAYEAVVRTGRGRYRGVPLESAAGRLRLRRNRLEARDLVLKRPDGELTGELTADFEQQQLVFNMKTTANPTPMAGLLGERAATTMTPYQFGPQLFASAKGFVDFANPQRVTWTAEVDDTRFSWWKLTADQGHARLHFSNDVCHLQLDTKGVTYGTNRADRLRAELWIARDSVKATNVTAIIGNGNVEGYAVTDLPRQRVDFQFQSTADPHILAALLGPNAAQKLQPYRFGSNTVIAATGIADLQKSNQTVWAADLVTDSFAYRQLSASPLNAHLTLTNEVLRIHARSPRLLWASIGADQVEASLTFSNEMFQAQTRAEGLQWWKLKAGPARADIVGSHETYAIRPIAASMYGGTLRGEAELRPAGTNTAFRLAFDADQWDIQQFLQTSGSVHTNASGRFKGHLDLTGTGTDFPTYQGGGNLEIANGVLLEVPLFGIFSHILNLIVPGLGSTAVTKANCTYSIANQIIRTDDLQFETGAAAVRSRGAIGFPKGDLDFRVEAQPMRSWPGINILTWMFGKIFEYKIGGTLDNPNWRPTRLPKEILPHSEGKPQEPEPKPESKPSSP